MGVKLLGKNPFLSLKREEYGKREGVERDY